MVEYNFVWRYTAIYAIIETGGKQFRVTPGQAIDVERLDVVPGNTIDLDKVLLIADGEKVTVGQPTISGAKVVATVERQDKGKKVIVFRYKSKGHRRNKIGHRQPYTRLVIDKIESEAAPSGPKKRVRRRKAEVAADGT